MLLHVNNDMENGIIAKIPLALDKDIKNFQGMRSTLKSPPATSSLFPPKTFIPTNPFSRFFPAVLN